MPYSRLYISCLFILCFVYSGVSAEPLGIPNSGTCNVAVRHLQSGGPGWIDISAPGIPPEYARDILSKCSQMRTSKYRSRRSETEPEIEIQELARALQYDPLIMLDYVRNNFDYVPTFGSGNRATATLLAGRGNDWDLASLLISLLRAAGYTANYAVGDVWYEVDICADWLGVDHDPEIVGNIFYRGGIPGSIDIPNRMVLITRVWVEVEIDSTVYTFDPAMKLYETIDGIDLASATGFLAPTFINNALDGATQTADSIQNINETNIQSDLVQYSVNLVDTIRASYSDAYLAEIIGGRGIITEESSGYPDSLPYANQVVTQTSYSEIPDMFRHTVQISHAGIDASFYTYELTGKRVTLLYNENNEPELYVDGILIATGNETTPGTAEDLTVTVDHAYAAQGGTYADQSRTIPAYSGSIYSINLSLETASQNLIASHSEKLSQSLDNGLSEDSETVMGEAMMLIGLNWNVSESGFGNIINDIAHLRSVIHHHIGFVAQEQGYLIDVSGFTSTSSRSGNVEDKKAGVRCRALMASALEYGVLEQKQPEVPAVSTVRLIQLNNEYGNKTFFSDMSNWNSIEPQLINYSQGLKSIVEGYINSGWEAVLPENGDILFNQYHGLGILLHYSDTDTTGMGLLIFGDYNGGKSSMFDELDVLDISDTQEIEDAWEEGWKTDRSTEPVDLRTGAFICDATDIKLGKSGIKGIEFRRHYSSDKNRRDGVLGRGWSHNYDMSLQELSHSSAGIGLGTPEQSAAAVTANLVMLNLLLNDIDLTDWTIANLTARWSMDQQIDNAVAVSLSNKTFMFIKMPDGSFSNNPESFMRLGYDSNYYISEMSGMRYDFNTEGNLTRIYDANDGFMFMNYNEQGLLSTITDAQHSHTVTLSYSSGKLINIGYNTDHYVYYGYDGDKLISYTDPLTHVTSYNYDADYRMTSITKPRGYTMVYNTYDDLGRVKEQRNAFNRVFNRFYISGYRNVMEDADDTQFVYYYDQWGRLIRFDDGLGESRFMTYNGLGQMILDTDRNGGLTAYTYDPVTHRQATITDADNHTTTYTYELRQSSKGVGRDPDAYYDLARVDYADGTSDEFIHDENGNVLTHINRAGKTSLYTYNSLGDVLTETNPTGGVTTFTYEHHANLATAGSTTVGTVLYTYDQWGRMTRTDYPGGAYKTYTFDDMSHLLTSTDERGNTYTYEYDENGNRTRFIDPKGNAMIFQYDEMDRMTQETDRRGFSSTYTYDDMDRLLRSTDADSVFREYGYDANGRRNLTRNGGSPYFWFTEFDAEGVTNKKITPMDNEVNYEINPMGYATAIVDPMMHRFVTNRDARQRVSSETDAMLRTTTYSYNGWDQVEDVTLPVIGNVNFEYNDLGMPTAITDFNDYTWNFTYNTSGAITSHTDPLGNTWQHTYDNRSRRDVTTYPDGDILTRTWDDAGNILQWNFNSGLIITNTYDPDLNRLTSTNEIAFDFNEEGQVTSTVNQNSTAFQAEYYESGRLASVSYANGAFIVNYYYDNSTGKLEYVSDTLTGETLRIVRNSELQRIRIEWPNSKITYYTWNDASQLTGIQHGPLASVNYGLDAAGEVISIDLDAPLDPMDAITSGAESYSYDSASQLTGAEFSYDARGQLLDDGVRTYSWDAMGRLIAAGSKTMDYNGRDDLIRINDAGSTLGLYYNYGIAPGCVVAERNETMNQWLRFYVYTPEGRLLYMIDAENGNMPYYYHFDKSGNTLLLSDPAGNVYDAYAYGLFGEVLVENGLSQQPFKFNGELGVYKFPGDTHLYKMGKRYYDAATARFLSRDRAGIRPSDPFSVNPYQFARLNPLNFHDASGMMVQNDMDDKGGGVKPNRSTLQTIMMLDEWLQEASGVLQYIDGVVPDGFFEWLDVGFQIYYLTEGGAALNYKNRYESLGSRVVRLVTDFGAQNARQVANDLNKPLWNTDRQGAEIGYAAYEHYERMNLTNEENARQVQKDMQNEGSIAQSVAKGISRIDTVVSGRNEANARDVKRDLQKPFYHPDRMIVSTVNAIWDWFN